jgi:hypothetical protein
MRHKRKSIPPAALCRIIGIDPTQRHWRRDLTQALKVLNEHLALLHVSEEMARRLRRYKVPPIPAEYRMEEVDDGQQIKFVAIERRYGSGLDDMNMNESDEPAIASITKRKRPIKRRRSQRRQQSIPRARLSPERELELQQRKLQQQQERPVFDETLTLLKLASSGDREAERKLRDLVWQEK